MSEPLGSYLVRMLVALAIGGAIGLEREFHGKPAGIRTNMLMCIGSCIVMIISIEIARTAGRVADPGRIAAQVVTGVGFLGAGTIIRSRFHVSGLTTAATIWVLSALGLAIGAGYIVLAVAGALFITVTLIFVRHIEGAIFRRRATHIVQLTLDERSGIIASIIAAFGRLDIRSEALEVLRAGGARTATFEYTTSLEKHHRLLEDLTRLDGVREVTEL